MSAPLVDNTNINNGYPLYKAEDIAFCNTSEFTKAGKYFLKNGVYTKAPEGTKDFVDFWDREEYRREHGMTLPGKLMTNARGETVIQDVHITGEHYGFLNYGQILRTKDPEDVADVIKGGHLLKHARKTGEKDRSFPDFWDGHFHFFNAKAQARAMGLHLAASKGRRKGFSYIGGWSAANKYDRYKFRTTVIGAFDKKYLTKGDGTMTMAKNYLDFLNEHTDWYKNRLIDAVDHVKSGYKLRGVPGERGYRSQIIAVSFGPSNPDAAIGKDAEEIQFEEAGKFPNLLESLEVTIPTLEDGDLVTGLIVVYGTGGTKEANWEDFEKLFYNPSLYGFMAFDNIWDDNSRGLPCGFFFPHQQNLIPHIDDAGNSNTKSALASMDRKRAIKKNASQSPADYQLYIGQHPKNPREAFSRTSNKYLYSRELEEHWNNLTRDPQYKQIFRAGRLHYNAEGKIVLDEGQATKTPPIFDFPLKEKNVSKDGCFLEWSPPYRNDKGEIPAGLYTAWHDPYATDKDADKVSVHDSFGAVYIYENINNFTPGRGDRVVAEYYGRPPKVDDYNEQLFMILKYYNAKMMFENDRGDVIPYAKRNREQRHTNYLMPEPDVIVRKQLGKKLGREYGMSMDDKKKIKGAKWFKDWLYTQRSVDGENNALYNFHYIYSPALIKECMDWDLIGNFDRVSACIVGQYQIQQSLYEDQDTQENDEEDDYFTRKKYGK